MRPQTKNTILFIVLMVLCFGIWYGLNRWFAPAPVPPPPPPPEPAAANAALGSLGQTALQTEGKPPAPEAKPEEKPAPPPVVRAESPPLPRDKALPALAASTAGLLGSAAGQGSLVAASSALVPGRVPAAFRELGALDRNSKFHLYVKLSPHGAGVLRLVLNKFQQADSSGRPVNLPDGSPKPEELIPEDPDNLSYLLLAYEVNNDKADRPFDTLGKVEWTVTGPESSPLPDGRIRQTVTFTSPPLKELHGLQVTKEFSLTEGDYHLGLEVKVKRVDGDSSPVTFRYQMTGGHGLPVEGRWYTGVFRNALIGQVEKNKADYGSRGVDRNYQDLRRSPLGRAAKRWPSGTATLSATLASPCNTSPRSSWWTTTRRTSPTWPGSADAGDRGRQGRRQERARQRLRAGPQRRQGTDFHHP